MAEMIHVEDFRVRVFLMPPRMIYVDVMPLWCRLVVVVEGPAEGEVAPGIYLSPDLGGLDDTEARFVRAGQGEGPYPFWLGEHVYVEARWLEAHAAPFCRRFVRYAIRQGIKALKRPKRSKLKEVSCAEVSY